ncbi:MAG: xanthine phosphoribosyltransferase [Motiliproteus sp.]
MIQHDNKQQYVSWEEFHQQCRALAAHLKPIHPWQGIVAIARGGLAPAAILAQELDIRLVETVCISSYQEGENNISDIQDELQILKSIDGNGADWLIIDDLVDSGQTAQAVKTLLPKAHLATLYAKPAGQHLVDTYVTDIDQHTWVVFPWEN